MGRQLAGVGPRTKSTVGSTTTCCFAAVNLNVLGNDEVYVDDHHLAQASL